jgi:hypothetical protein
LIPLLMISFEQSRHGECVQYRVEPSTAIALRAAQAMALASAWMVRMQGFDRSQTSDAQ